MNVYGVLESEWARIAATPAAARQIKRWVATEPVLTGWATPADLVAAIVAQRRWGQADHRLAALVRLAGQDVFAARAALQAILPALRAESILPTFRTQPSDRSRYRRPPAGPDDDIEDVTVELIGLAWEAIRTRSWPDSADPQNALVRTAIDKLRSRRRAESLTQDRTDVLFETNDGGLVELEAARSSAEQAILALADAVRAKVVSRRQAQLLYSVRVACIPGRDVGRRYGMTPGQVFHVLEVSETALRPAIA